MLTSECGDCGTPNERELALRQSLESHLRQWVDTSTPTYITAEPLLEIPPTRVGGLFIPAMGSGRKWNFHQLSLVGFFHRFWSKPV